MADASDLHMQHLESCVEAEPTYYMQQQSLAKVLSAGRYQHGVSRNKLIHYSYGAGELIVCNRGIDEFCALGQRDTHPQDRLAGHSVSGDC